MKTLVKSCIRGAFGELFLQRLGAKLRGRRLTFSEHDLVLAYFDSRRGKGVMLDVGAHHGTTALPFLNKSWEVYAFEPDPANRRLLQKFADRPNLHILDVAVSDKEAEDMPFFASEISTGISGLSKFVDSHREVCHVKVTTLEKVLGKHQIAQVDYLKIDTEGFDLFVLRGFPWSTTKPEVVVAEFDDFKTVSLGYTYDTMGKFLLSHGYKVFISEWCPMERYGGHHHWADWRPFPSTLLSEKGHGNFVAFKAGADLSAVERYLARHAQEKRPHLT